MDLLKDYDYEYDSLYFKVDNELTYNYTIEIEPFIFIDISNEKNIIGFEVLSASSTFNISKKELANTEDVKITVNINEEVIKIIFKIKTSEYNWIEYHTKVINTDEELIGEYEYEYTGENIN